MTEYNDSTRTGDALSLDAALRLPDHVVYRSFIAETVVLNLETAHYHGLNPIAAHMLKRLTEEPTLGAAVQRVAQEYQHEPSVVEADMRDLAQDLLARGLLVRVDD